MSTGPRILFCNCTYAQVVPKEVKESVLRQLCEAGVSFEAVADLCEMSARRDRALANLAQGDVKIAACFPRAVKWLFAAAGAPLTPEGAEILNMRAEPAARIIEALMDAQLNPNLPSGQAVPPPASESTPVPATPIS